MRFPQESLGKWSVRFPYAVPDDKQIRQGLDWRVNFFPKRMRERNQVRFLVEMNLKSICKIDFLHKVCFTGPYNIVKTNEN